MSHKILNHKFIFFDEESVSTRVGGLDYLKEDSNE
jgi:hypothetical protein